MPRRAGARTRLPPGPRRRRGQRAGSAAPGAPAWIPGGEGTVAVLLVASVICIVSFYGTGGRETARASASEIGLTLLAGAVIAVCLVLEGSRQAWRQRAGTWPLVLMLCFAALTALSVAWSVQPDASWREANLVLSYSAAFAAAVVLARTLPGHWSSLLGGTLLACVVVCCDGLASKVFPGSLAQAGAPARLLEPFGYWNAVGLCAAMGVICCMWLGARREGHGLLNALAYPASGLLLLTLLLAYSRGALAALVLGGALWLVVVPLRLRAAVLLLVSGAGAGAVAAWDFSNSSLSSEGVSLAQRTSGGHELGALIVVMVVVLTAVGAVLAFATARHAPRGRTRVRAGAALAAIPAIALLALLAAMTVSHRGLTGSISHALSSLTNPNAKPPPNTPGRLTAVASVRARYWKEALQVFGAHPWLGAGAEGYATARLRYRQDTLVVAHAHGWVVQTLADLGILGLLVALALFGSWALAASRAARPLRRGPFTRERIGMLTLLCVVVVFGIHSFVDWTWYVPGTALIALLCAGWLAGRGPLGAGGALGARGALRAWGGGEEGGAGSGGGADARSATAAPDPPRDAPWATWPPAGRRRAITVPRVLAALAERPRATAALVLLAALLAAWSEWQPQRSEEARTQALALLASRRPAAALRQARTAVARDPLSVEALFALADVQDAAVSHASARATLARAVKLQPSNPQTWLELGREDLSTDPHAALSELRAAIYLNPESIAPEAISGPTAQHEAIAIDNAYIEAVRAGG